MNILRQIRAAVLGFFLLAAPLHGAAAEELLRHEDSHSNVELHLERSALVRGETVWLGFHVEPREGWHTYWKNPGDSGATTILEWQAPEGLTVGTAEYPSPERIPVAHLMNYGYKAQSTILVPLKLDRGFASDIATVELVAEWLVCEVECVPQVGEWTLQLPVADTAGANVSSRQIFIDARAHLPELAYWDAKLVLADVSSELYVFADQSELVGLTDAYFFPENEGIATYAGEQIWSIDDMGLQVRIPKARGASNPENANGILQLVFESGETQAFDLEPMLKLPETTAVSTDTQFGAMPLWQAAIYAFLGGLILNLMPCVFPILSLKAFAFVAANYKTEANRRKEGWAYTLGIWISFMAIVAVLIGLRAGGAAIGWGFQLQEPIFVGLLALLMIVVAMSLAGVFTIQTGFEHAGQGLTEREGLQGAFFKGVLATLVATPCTAPLMAPAIGFALTQPIPTVITVFSLLAFGLALPFLALSYSARIAAMMPKPGAWMETVKQGLAFPMLLTAAWLIYVFDLQAGATSTMFLIGSAIVLVFALWLWQKVSASIVGKLFALAFALISFAGLYWSSEVGSTAPAQTEASGEKAYSEARLKGLLDEGKPVFVYFTAEWCITCKVNEKVALHRDETQAVFDEKGVTVLKGDWTNRNDEIATVLARYGRAGVPLYLYFPAGSREAEVLPELITVSSIIGIL